MKLTRVRMGLVVLAVVAASLVGGHATPPGEAYAHANLARSAPAPNSTLDSPPNQVVVWFTEPVEPKFSEIQVLDIAGARVDRDDSIVDRNDPTAVSVTLEPLPDGTYTVAWTNVSTVDGHRVRGSFVFSVGEPISGAPVDVPNQPLVQSPWEPVFRWLILLTSLSIVGGLAFELMVWRPVLSGSDVRPALFGQRRRMGSRSLKLILLAVGLCLVGSIGQLVIQTQAVHDISLAEALGGSMGATLSDTEWGRLWLWRVGLLAAVGVALVPVLLFSWGSGEDKVDRLRRYLLAAALAIGGGMLFVHSMGSHGAATAGIETPALFSDYLHLLAAAFWVGGLVHFALGAPLLIGGLDPDDRGAFLSALAPRFSTLAILSVGVLVVTGIYSGWAQVTVLAATNTPYGLTLVSKLALIVPLLALGAVNLLWIRPRLAVDDSARRWLKRLVAGEVVLAVVVLAAVAMLASLEPARQVASREGVGQENKLTFRDTAEGADIVLEVEPGRVGPNRVLVSLEDRLGVPIDNASDVSVRLTYLDADLGETRATAGSLGGGDYAVEEVLLSIAGPWQVEVVVRRPDAFDARTAFRFEAGPGGVGLAVRPYLPLRIPESSCGEWNWRCWERCSSASESRWEVGTPGGARLPCGRVLRLPVRGSLSWRRPSSGSLEMRGRCATHSLPTRSLWKRVSRPTRPTARFATGLLAEGTDQERGGWTRRRQTWSFMFLTIPRATCSVSYMTAFLERLWLLWVSNSPTRKSGT